MKIHVFFIDEHDSSKQNGIGTYRDILLSLLAPMPEFDLTLISLNSDCNDLMASRRDFGVEYALPQVGGGNWRENGDIIWPILRLYVKDSKRNVFIFNHSPCAQCIDSLKSVFPLSRTVFVIHDQGWCASLFGDSNLLSDIEQGIRPKRISKKTMDFVRGYCSKEREIYKRVDAVVSLSDSTEKILREIYHTPAEKIVKIPNGYMSDSTGIPSRRSARRRLGIKPEDQLLVFVARPARYKGIEALLKAMAIVRNHHPYLRCALIGSAVGFMNYQTLAKPIAANLIYTGQISRNEVRDWYAAADVGMLTSYTEQCSFAALEMMDCGLKMISSDGNGLRDMFIDGQNARVVHVGDVTDNDFYSRELALAINEILATSESYRRRMAKANRRLLLDRFSAKTMAARYRALLKNVVNLSY